MTYETLDVRFANGVCRVRLNRPASGNALNGRMIEELAAVVSRCEAMDGEAPVTVLVLEGSPEVFCSGGDLEAAGGGDPLDPAPLYDLWSRLLSGPFVSIALVRGRANAGGVGLAVACDLVLAARTATFALSELLFGLFPACVMPFLARRAGLQRAHYLALMTRPINADEALAFGIADAVGDDTDVLLSGHLRRLTHLSKPAIHRYKRYMGDLAGMIASAKPRALEANREMFQDPVVRHNIARYVSEMKLPWET